MTPLQEQALQTAIDNFADKVRKAEKLLHTKNTQGEEFAHALSAVGVARRHLEQVVRTQRAK